MTAADIWLPALGAIAERARLIGDGFGVEVALVWPLVDGSVGQEIIVGAGSRELGGTPRTVGDLDHSITVATGPPSMAAARSRARRFTRVSARQ